MLLILKLMKPLFYHWFQAYQPPLLWPNWTINPGAWRCSGSIRWTSLTCQQSSGSQCYFWPAWGPLGHWGCSSRLENRQIFTPVWDLCHCPMERKRKEVNLCHGAFEELRAPCDLQDIHQVQQLFTDLRNINIKWHTFEQYFLYRVYKSVKKYSIW